MSHKLGVSGSVILSNPKLFSELFWDGIDHIEIGEFYDEIALDKFLRLCKKNQTCFGIHSPLFRNGSKYDLIEKVQYDSKYAWEQLESEAKQIASLGAKYILVHFPYFKQEVTCNTNELIEKGLKRFSALQKQYSIEIICEPKLGLNRSAAGIHYLQSFPKEIWRKYNIKLCIDIGDYIIATDKEIINYLLKWKEFIKVVHLHNIYYKESKYIWVPVHPTHEQDKNYYKVEKIIRFLSKCKDVTFVFEHTPDTNPSKDFVNEGYKWVRSLIS
jgi:sugar phosphate isomerase/epimerase